jgi:hypothetical protein
MPKKTALQAAAAKDEEQKRAKKARGLLGALAALIGLGGDKPAARTAKRTETTKHTVLEESDTDSGEEEEEEEESDMGSESSEPGTDDSDASSSSEEEEEEEEEEERAAKGKMSEEEEEEEEEKALARAVRAAYRSPELQAAFLAAVPEKYRLAASLRAPARLAREMKKATGAKSIDGAMTSLSRLRTKARTADAKTIAQTARLTAEVAKLKSDGRRQRIEALVSEAKASGRASNKDLRAKLREYGMAKGERALKALVETLPEARTAPRLPKADMRGNTVGAPSTADQVRMREQAMAGLSAEDRAAFEQIEQSKLNGIAREEV